MSIYRYERRVWLAINGEDGIKLSEQILPAKKLQDYWKKKGMSSRNRTLVRRTLYGSNVLPGAKKA
ncbi:MAG TPA: hypothetical protein VMW36_08360 [Patescibacteria group bacterium]|nr:hypothetical protein [Patescibacteria group bacterium]